jgi:hypothetical protein
MDGEHGARHVAVISLSHPTPALIGCGLFGQGA